MTRTPRPFKRATRRGWWFNYKDARGRWRLKLGGRTKADAMIQIIVTDQEMLNPEKFARHSRATDPIAIVISEFERSMDCKARSTSHIRVTIGDLCTIFGIADHDLERRLRRHRAPGFRPKCCPWDTLSDIEPGSFERFLDDVSDRLSVNRRNRYRSSLSQFVGWAIKRRYLPSNPIASIALLPEGRDRRRVRRAMTEAQVWRLIDRTKQCGPGGAKRSVFYWIAFRLGLRWSEIRRLQAKNFDLGSDPCMMLDGGITKNGREAILPIPNDLLKAVRDHITMQGVMFRSMPSLKTWRADLDRAGIDYKTPDGCAYRGSTRTTFGTHLYRAGVDLRTAQELMRHSDPKLTSKIYQRVRLADTRPAINKLERADPVLFTELQA